MDYSKMRRMWINQPSTLQPLHRYHGHNVIAAPKDPSGNVMIYFTRGPVISFEAPELALSKGWVNGQGEEGA